MDGGEDGGNSRGYGGGGGDVPLPLWHKQLLLLLLHRRGQGELGGNWGETGGEGGWSEGGGRAFPGEVGSDSPEWTGLWLGTEGGCGSG